MAWVALDRYLVPLVDLIKAITHSSTALLLGGLLLVLLVMRSSPGFAKWIRRTLAQRLRAMRFSKGSFWQASVDELSDWLDPPLTRHTPINRNRGCHANLTSERRARYASGMIISSATQMYYLRAFKSECRAYATSDLETDRGCFLGKLAINRTGDRLLKKEMWILDYLRRQSAGMVYQQYLPEPIERFQCQDRVVTVFASSQDECYSAHQIRRRFSDGLPGEHVAWMFNRLLEGLGFIHRQGTVHGAVLPQHLLFNTQSHGLQIVDWTHAKQIGRP